MKVNLHYTSAEINADILHENDNLPLTTDSVVSSKFLEYLNSLNEFKVGLMPPAVRWISRNKDLVVFERPPMSQLVEYLPLERSQITSEHVKNVYSFQLQIPWTVYLVHFDKNYTPVTIKVFVRNTYLSSLDDNVYLLPLLNFYNNSQLCNPRQNTFEGLPSDLGEGINMAYNMVWNSGWNFDLKDAVAIGVRSSVPFKINDTMNWDKIILEWHKLWSQKTREEILSMTWPHASLDQRGGGSLLGLSTVIDHTQGEIARDYPNVGGNFMITMASGLV